MAVRTTIPILFRAWVSRSGSTGETSEYLSDQVAVQLARQCAIEAYRRYTAVSDEERNAEIAGISPAFYRLILSMWAARMKSLSVSPSILCVQILRSA